jgi:hypothetical protein
VAGARQQSPGNRHLRDVEVTIGKWNEDGRDGAC